MGIRQMMNTTAICAVLAGLSAGVWAEDTVTPLAKPQVGAVSGAAVTAPAATPVLAGKLIGRPVRDSAGQRIGNVTDLVIAPDRRVDQLVVGVGGLLGVGDRLVAMPVSSFSSGPEGLTLAGATKEALKLLPEFDKTAFSEVAGGQGGLAAGTHIAPATLASAMIGASVRDGAGQKIGTVDDLVIAPDRRIEQLVLSVGGFLGLGEKLVALPVAGLRAQADGLILAGASRQSLEASPAFDKASVASAVPAAPATSSDMDRLRADYQAKMDEWGRRIGEYRDKAVDGADQTKEKMRRSLDSAWEKARAQWSEFKDATAETYDAAKTKLDRAIQDLDRSWQETTG